MLIASLRPGLASVPHGKKYNQLWSDGHVAAMNSPVLFNPTNIAPHFGIQIINPTLKAGRPKPKCPVQVMLEN